MTIADVPMLTDLVTSVGGEDPGGTFPARVMLNEVKHIFRMSS
jgi:hypothetical protein